jgi:uncharacterized protein (DUF885 family)
MTFSIAMRRPPLLSDGWDLLMSACFWLSSQSCGMCPSRRRRWCGMRGRDGGFDLGRTLLPVSGAVQLADDYWRYYRDTSQLWNIDRGDVSQIDRWEDLSASGVTERIGSLRDFVARAEGLAAEDADEDHVPLLAAVSFSAAATAAQLPWMCNRGLVSSPFNFATFLSVLVPGYRLVTHRHGEGYVAKLDAIPVFIDGWIDGLRDGLGKGQLATARGIANAIEAYDRLLSTDVSSDPLAGQDPPSEVSDVEASAWRHDVIATITRSVRPAVAALRDVLQHELLPAACSDEHPGLCHLPDGADAYGELLWAATSTRHSADAIHEIGLTQLALLDDEYRQLGAEVLGLNDPTLVRDQLRQDPGLRYSTTDEIIDDVRAMVDRARQAAPAWFSRLPRAECVVVPVDAGGAAYYTAPSPDGDRPGTFYFHADPSRWTRFALAPTTFHEAIPGHHLQLALALELDVHPVLGELEVTAYGEGWGLYAERLADEMGLYTTGLQRLGMLTMDSLRASRLVVDTGVHGKGWTRQQGIDFLYAHTALTPADASAETDRYIADPGQATSYMIGRLEIERLRDDARARLGHRFSAASFHDTILHGGMAPLPELARRIDRWITRTAVEP